MPSPNDRITPITESWSDLARASRPSITAATTAPISAPYSTPIPSSSAAAPPVRASSRRAVHRERHAAHDDQRAQHPGHQAEDRGREQRRLDDGQLGDQLPRLAEVEQIQDSAHLLFDVMFVVVRLLLASALCAPAMWIWPPT